MEYEVVADLKIHDGKVSFRDYYPVGFDDKQVIRIRRLQRAILFPGSDTFARDPIATVALERLQEREALSLSEQHQDLVSRASTLAPDDLERCVDVGRQLAILVRYWRGDADVNALAEAGLTEKQVAAAKVRIQGRVDVASYASDVDSVETIRNWNYREREEAVTFLEKLFSTLNDESDDLKQAVFSNANIINFSLRNCKLNDLIKKMDNSYGAVRTLRISSRLLDCDTLGHLAEKLPGLSELNLNFCFNLTDKGLSRLALHCKELRRLNLTGCSHITDAAIATLSKANPQLREVYLRGTRVRAPGIAVLSANCRELEAIDLSGCINKEGLGYLSDHCQHIRWLNMGAHYWRVDSIRCAMLKWPKLRHLQVFPDALDLGGSQSGSSLTTLRTGSVNNVKILRVLESNPHLETLAFSGSWDLKEDWGLVQKMRHLQDLVHSGSVPIDAAFLVDRGLSQRPLRTLGIDSISGACNVRFDRLPMDELEALKIEHDRELDDRSFASLIRKAPRLRWFWCGESGLTSLSIQRLVHGSPYLELLSARSIKLSSECLHDLATWCSRLKYLDVGFLEVKDTDLERLGDSCPDLHGLYLPHCTSLTLQGLKELARRCPGLRLIELDGWGGLQDNDLEELVACLPNLIAIHLRDCANLTTRIFSGHRWKRVSVGSAEVLISPAIDVRSSRHSPFQLWDSGEADLWMLLGLEIPAGVARALMLPPLF